MTQLVRRVGQRFMVGFEGLAASADVKALVREFGVATIPLSAFYQDGTDHRVIRFCFAKRDETLREAARRLQRLGRGPAPAGTG